MRYTGPVFKKSRRYGFSILETGKEFAKGKKRTTPPGQHGAARKKISGYGTQLHEKQKIQFMYGLTERQLRKTFKTAKGMPGILGQNLLALLEARLDNVVFKAGLAPTRRGSRQLVAHGHVKVDGKKVDIPSFTVKAGMVITIREKSQELAIIKETMANAVAAPFLKVDKAALQAEFLRMPERKEMNQELNEQLVVEWYNRLV